jgi:hypothetical protein
MLRSLKDLRGFAAQARDGDLGPVRDFYFDDVTWRIRYAVVDTGGWLSGRRVLVSPESIDVPGPGQRTLNVQLDKRTVEDGPSIGEERPVSRQDELLVREHFGWAPYWGAPFLHAPTTELAALRSDGRNIEAASGASNDDDPHLRSVDEVTGYHLRATDGEIGHVDDYIVELPDWRIRFLVADTRNLIPGRRVLLARAWVRDVRWPEGRIVIDLPREAVKNSPPFDPSAAVNEETVRRMFDYYGRPALTD